MVPKDQTLAPARGSSGPKTFDLRWRMGVATLAATAVQRAVCAVKGKSIFSLREAAVSLSAYEERRHSPSEWMTKWSTSTRAVYMGQR